MPKTPARRSSSTEITRFLQKSRAITRFQAGKARLLFSLDATASRQPTWDHASHLQQEMFRAVQDNNALSVQLCYYRGFGEFHASRWTGDAQEITRAMARVHCEGGHTQIERLLRHALAEHGQEKIRALVFIGDALEENPDTLCQLAGQCGLLQLPLFVFQEGRQPAVEQCFRALARLSGGAWASFDQSSAATLAALLRAVASYATGGVAALEKQGNESAKLLLQQIKH
ncbi:VWA domain-containing protein [Haliea sp. E17]|uniref:VWA domain-containing protein n=1 Tax=Haliea sp. E17 TaxID=3401576 RepID=UPI003AAC3908